MGDVGFCKDDESTNEKIATSASFALVVCGALWLHQNTYIEPLFQDFDCKRQPIAVPSPHFLGSAFIAGTLIITLLYLKISFIT